MRQSINEGARERGFASMERARQREIASMGGRAAHRQGTAHQFTSDEARAAGRKGGESVSTNRAHMAAIGRKGGEASRRRTRAAAARNRPEVSETVARIPVAPAADGASAAAAVPAPRGEIDGTRDDAARSVAPADGPLSRD